MLCWSSIAHNIAQYAVFLCLDKIAKQEIERKKSPSYSLYIWRSEFEVLLVICVVWWLLIDFPWLLAVLTFFTYLASCKGEIRKVSLVDHFASLYAIPESLCLFFVGYWLKAVTFLGSFFENRLTQLIGDTIHHLFICIQRWASGVVEWGRTSWQEQSEIDSGIVSNATPPFISTSTPHSGDSIGKRVAAMRRRSHIVNH